MSVIDKRRPEGHGGVTILEVGLNAAIVSVADDQPRILTLRPDGQMPKTDDLPHGLYLPSKHLTLDGGLRSWVSTQTGLTLGYVEQLFTFGEQAMQGRLGESGPQTISIGYLALTRHADDQPLTGGHWRSWYEFFPWEDWRDGKPRVLAAEIEPRLRRWIEGPANGHTPVERAERLRINFGLDGGSWDEEKVQERFDIMVEAGLLPEAKSEATDSAAPDTYVWAGESLTRHHRRILATAIGRLRAKIKYRPVVFELMPADFTLFELQKTVEAILGSRLHKQNFRRLVEAAGLVDTTGEVRNHTGGRPAKLYRFRREVLLERPAPGVRVRAGAAH
ncbi:MAG: NAD regulator [Hyphomicrobiaceae bacterium]